MVMVMVMVRMMVLLCMVCVCGCGCGWEKLIVLQVIVRAVMEICVFVE